MYNKKEKLLNQSVVSNDKPSLLLDSPLLDYNMSDVNQSINLELLNYKERALNSISD